MADLKCKLIIYHVSVKHSRIIETNTITRLREGGTLIYLRNSF